MPRPPPPDIRDDTGHLIRELHGVTLEKILHYLVERFGWDELAKRFPFRCFAFDPSVKSSLAFLRTTPWARTKVEELYVRSRTGELRKKAKEDALAKEAAPPDVETPKQAVPENK